MMEKLAQLKSKLLKFLPRQPVASMAFQNPTLSPSRSLAGSGGGSRTPPHHIVSIIPKEARRKLKSSSFSAREPGSPKVSCMGEVKGKKKRKAFKCKSVLHHPPSKEQSGSVSCPEKVKKEKMLLWIFKGKQSGKALVLELEEKATATESTVPSLGTMKKFASGRETLSDFNVKLA